MVEEMVKREKAATIGAVFLIIIIIVGDLLAGFAGSHAVPATPLTCVNPPQGNPNKCHVYSWNPFPVDTGLTPPTGLFNNDTSYYQTFNSTSIVSFTMCIQVISVGLPPGFVSGANETFVLQYFNGVSWADVATNGGGSGGAIVVPSGTTLPIIVCSSQNGEANFGGCSPALSGNIGCSIRIGANQGTLAGVTADNLQIAELTVQFYFSSFAATNTITCTVTTASTTQFTNVCARPIQAASQSITVSWEANNLGLAFQKGTLTCTFALNANTCTKLVTFAPAFAVAPSVSETWTPILGTGSVSASPGMVVQFLS